MSDAAPVKVKKVKKPAAKKAADHPKYIDMVKAAIGTLKERNGSSRQAILKYINANYTVSEKAPTNTKNALKKGVAAGSLKQVKGTGASGSFKLAEKEKAAKKPAAKKAATKKPAAKKAATAKNPVAKKAAKKTPKKSAKNPAAKKTIAHGDSKYFIRSYTLHPLWCPMYCHHLYLNLQSVLILLHRSQAS